MKTFRGTGKGYEPFQNSSTSFTKKIKDENVPFKFSTIPCPSQVQWWLYSQFWLSKSIRLKYSQCFGLCGVEEWHNVINFYHNHGIVLPLENCYDYYYHDISFLRPPAMKPGLESREMVVLMSMFTTISAVS